MLTSAYNAHNNKNKNNDKKVISIAQLCLSAVLKIDHSNIITCVHINSTYVHFCVKHKVYRPNGAVPMDINMKNKHGCWTDETHVLKHF